MFFNPFHLQYEDDTFWCDCCSPLVHPVGWSQLVGHKIIASPEYCAKSLAKIKVNQFERNDAAPHMFPAVSVLFCFSFLYCLMT